jgi:hypothetical protein
MRYNRFFTALIYFIASVGLATTFSGCREKNWSYDVIQGPENVVQAPLLDTTVNIQEDDVNTALYRQALKDSAFFTKRARPETAYDSASAPLDTSVSGKDVSAEAGVNMSADKIQAPAK